MLVLALLAGLGSLRLGHTLLLISRHGPSQNLRAQWSGSTIVECSRPDVKEDP